MRKGQEFWEKFWKCLLAESSKWLLEERYGIHHDIPLEVWLRGRYLEFEEMTKIVPRWREKKPEELFFRARVDYTQRSRKSLSTETPT